MSSLVFDSLACAIVDSGCTKTVIGRNWLDLYKERLDKQHLKNMVSEPYVVPFSYGDGVEVISKFKTKIPGQIGSSSILIEANVV